MNIAEKAREFDPEWVQLMEEAFKAGITPEEIRNFLSSKTME